MNSRPSSCSARRLAGPVDIWCGQRKNPATAVELLRRPHSTGRPLCVIVDGSIASRDNIPTAPANGPCPYAATAVTPVQRVRHASGRSCPEGFPSPGPGLGRTTRTPALAPIRAPFCRARHRRVLPPCPHTTQTGPAPSPRDIVDWVRIIGDITGNTTQRSPDMCGSWPLPLRDWRVAPPSWCAWQRDWPMRPNAAAPRVTRSQTTLPRAWQRGAAEVPQSPVRGAWIGA